MSQVSLTAGPAFGFGRPPSLDIVTSAWLDTYVSFSSKVHSLIYIFIGFID